GPLLWPDQVPDRALRPDPVRPCARERRARLVSRVVRRAGRIGREPDRGGARQLAGDAHCDAGCVAAHGLSRRNSGGSETAVVVPTMLASAKSIDDMAEALEV